MLSRTLSLLSLLLLFSSCVNDAVPFHKTDKDDNGAGTYLKTIGVYIHDDPYGETENDYLLLLLSDEQFPSRTIFETDFDVSKRNITVYVYHPITTGGGFATWQSAVADHSISLKNNVTYTLRVQNFYSTYTYLVRIDPGIDLVPGSGKMEVELIKVEKTLDVPFFRFGFAE